MVGKRFFSLVGAISNLRASFVWKHHHQPMFMHRNTHSSSETWQYLFQSQKEVGASCCWSLADVRLGLTMEAVRMAECHFHSDLIVPIVALFRHLLSITPFTPFLLFALSPITNFFCLWYR
jgi:hypothetical protein